MESSSELLEKQCQENEELLRKLEHKTSKLPSSNHVWFYLDLEALVPQSVVEKKFVLTNCNQSFVTVVPRDGDRSTTSLEDVKCSQQSKKFPLAEEELKWIVNDPDLPVNIREYISRQNENGEVLDESDILTFCQYVISSEKSFSEITGTMLFKLVLHPKVSSSSDTFLSQLFLQKLQELTNKFPTCSINGIIIPLMKGSLEKHQLDAICAILNEMKVEHMEATSKELLLAIPGNRDISIKLLKIIMDRKPKFGPDIAFILVTKLVELNFTFSHNFQFGNLLIEIIPTLNEKLCEDSLQNLKVVVDEHKTFMKAPAQNLVSKLKIK